MARGDVVGWYGNGSTWEFHGYLLSKDGAAATIDIPGSTWNLAVALNNQGDVIVQAYDNWMVATSYRWNDGNLVRLEFPGAAWTSASGINDNGVIVGVYGTTGGEVHGFVAKPR